MSIIQGVQVTHILYLATFKRERKCDINHFAHISSLSLTLTSHSHTFWLIVHGAMLSAFTL